MGRRARRRPEYLAKKLREIRNGLGGLSQCELIERLGLAGHIDRSEISSFEKGVREPDLLTLKAYAFGAGISTDHLIDDDLELPEPLPAANLTGDSKGKQQKRRGGAPVKMTTVTLHLLIESDEGAAREEGRARKAIETDHLKRYGKRYGMRKLKDDEYELTVSHRNEADLDEQIYALLAAITIEARRRGCSLKVTAREKVTQRHW
jgi:transcriptional regulator with XRE-family HTH domain